MASCIENTVSESNLTKADAAELVRLYNINIELGYSDKTATQQAIKAMANDAIDARIELEDTAEAQGVDIPSRSLNFLDKVPEKASTAVSETAGRLKVPSITVGNLGVTIQRLKEIPFPKRDETPESLMVKKRRDSIVRRLQKIADSTNPDVGISSNRNAINTTLAELYSVITHPDPQVGDITQDSTQDTLAATILDSGVTYNTPLFNDTSALNERDTLATSFEVNKKAKITSVLQVFNNLFARLANVDGASEGFPKLSEQQQETIPALITFNELFAKTLIGTPESPGILKLLHQDFIYKNNLDGSFIEGADNNTSGDPSGYLIQVDNEGVKFLNPNIVSALAMTAYNWIATQGSSSLFNDKDAINRINGFQKDNYPGQLAFDTLTYAGLPKTALAESLGKRAFKLLGLKLKKGANGDIQARIELALGEAIISTMLHAKLAEQTTVEAEVMNKMHNNIDSNTTIDNSAPSNFISINSKVKVDKIGRDPANEMQDIIDIIKNSDGVMETLFDIKSFKTGPHTEKIKSVSKTLKGVPFMNVSKKMQKVVRRLQNVVWQAKTNVLDVYSELSFDDLLDINGYVRDIENNVHVDERKSVVAQNQRIERSLQHVQDFLDVDGNINASLYFEHEVFKNNRVGMVSNTINPQNDKIHRHLFGAKNWSQVVSSTRQRNNFKLAVVQALGKAVSHEGIDKDSMDGSKQAFDKLILDPVIQAGIAAIKAKNNPADIVAGCIGCL